jgi:hypothetical protein
MKIIFIVISIQLLICHYLLSQISDSISIDKNLRDKLLKTINKTELVEEGKMPIDEFYNYFKPVYLNNDTLVDFIYFGPSAGESNEVSIYLNFDNSLKIIKNELGKIDHINKPFPDSPVEFHFIQYGCCDDPHNYYQIWTLINDKIIEGVKYHFLEKTVIPKNFRFLFSIKVNNSPNTLRATPEIIDEKFDHNYNKGNIIAEFSKGDIGYVLDSTFDITGRLWYFVVMEKPKKMGYHNYEKYRNEKWMGWMSGRSVDIINYSR